MNEDEGPDDHFDRLSDELLTLIFNKVLDAKSLCRCSVVSKRFASLIPQTDNVSLIVPSSNSSKPKRGTFFIVCLKYLVGKFITKPLQFLYQTVVPKLSVNSDEDETYQFTTEVLRNFINIKRLSIQLPCHGDELGSKGTNYFLRWKAEFGRELESCVVLGATSFHRSSSTPSSHKKHKQLHEPMSATDELKTRVVWMISCLIAASTRHWLLKQIIVDSPMNPQSVMISDSSKQGRLIMGEEQFKELRRSMNPTAPVERTMVPAVRVKLWHVPVLELPASGRVMNGATLIVIRPAERTMKMESEDEGLGDCFEGEEEEEDLREAVREMLKEKKPYKIEMDSL